MEGGLIANGGRFVRLCWPLKAAKLICSREIGRKNERPAGFSVPAPALIIGSRRSGVLRPCSGEDVPEDCVRKRTDCLRGRVYIGGIETMSNSNSASFYS